LSTADAFALYPRLVATGSDSDSIGSESDQATDEIPAPAIMTIALFSMNVRRERFMDLFLDFDVI
jgi:hypothetical protein